MAEAAPAHQRNAQTANTERLPFVNLPKAILPIYLTTFVDMLGYTLLIPLLPAIAHKYGAADWVTGMLLSIPAACATIAAPIWGKTSDWAGRKFIILIAQAFTMTGYVMLALAPTLFWVFLSRFISGIGAGSLGTAQSYIADVTSEGQRERAYAIYGAVFGAAFIIGPVAAGMLERYGLQFPFYIAAILEVLNIVLTLWLLPSLKKRAQQPQTSVKHSIASALKPGVRSVLLRQFLFIFAVVFLLADFALYLNRQLHQGLQDVSWMLAGTGIVGGLTMVVIVTPLTKKIGDRPVAQIGLALLFCAFGFLYFVHSVWLFFAVLIPWAVGAAMVEPTLMAVLSRRAPEGERGAIMGLSDAVNSVALIFSPAIGTAVVWAQPRLIGVLPALAVALAFFLGRSVNEPSK